MTFEREKTLVPRKRKNLLREPRLPHSRLSSDQCEASLPRAKPFRKIPELRELALAPHENSLRRRARFQ